MARRRRDPNWEVEPGRHAREGRRKRRRAQAARVALIASLGGQCVSCGERDGAKLELDHTNGREWAPQELGQPQRIARYQREAAEGKLQVLCRSCNARKGNLVERALRRALARARRTPVATAASSSAEPSWITDPMGATDATAEPF